MQSSLKIAVWFLPLLLVACSGPSTHMPPAQSIAPLSVHGPLPGSRSDGFVQLPNQWLLHPTGHQVDVGDLPINIAVHPGGRFAAVLNTGYSTHEIIIVQIPDGKIVSHTKLDEAFYGIEFSRDGRQLFSSGAGDEVIHCFNFNNGDLSNHHHIRIRNSSDRGVPAGIAIDDNAKRLYVANIWGQRVSQVNLIGKATVTDFALTTNAASTAYPKIRPSTDFETAAATKRDEADLYKVLSTDPFPYACRVDTKRHRLYVSLWAQAKVAVIDLASNRIIANWPTEEHPNEMLLTRSGRLLFVANSARNSVSVIDTETGQPIETIWAALYPNTPPGSTPNSLALSPDEKTLFIANADNNMVAVIDVSDPGRSHSLGFIPVGWYPTSVRVTPDGRYLLVANGKGILPKANPGGPNPGVKSSGNPQYIARLLTGTLSIIEIPSSRDKFAEQLAAYTAQAYHCSPLKSDSSVSASRPADSPIPLKPGDPSPIKYCIYVIKENRTYDQVLGDIKEGNGDPKLCLFPEKVTPNEHKLVREFVLLDNFYVDSEVSADGHEWSMGAYATDFVEKFWPLTYGHNRRGKYPYPSEGNFPAAFPANGYLWDRAREAGVSYRSYGEFIANAKDGHPARARVKALEGHFDPEYRSFDLDYPDTKRAARFLQELKRFEAQGDMPRLQVVRLPNDHTHGGTVGSLTPTSYVADNDLGLGILVEGISHSKFWPQTAIFVVEDDAQNGPDHVDAHRSTVYVISPYTKHHKTDSTMYSTSSMLRTMELILGLQPMSQFDAAAAPLYNAFQTEPDLQPYTSLPAQVKLHEHNLPFGKAARLSRNMNFNKEDAVDDLLLNQVIWQAVMGEANPMPAPVRASFVFAHPRQDDDD
ncbi:bifunctional YncE family protein/alkaline phosphatase family protein [Pedosphaera parvula]|uniref:40-residue YVTN family beta-propeller repeat protein n=1 Tax=Pedosphaera parvula (strain Ellin514) TaxID=320771 RepID=B9XN09_PEDPL|nr:beta-propeller fold lactonase family protein [Pedosphaera parvula]EEF58805.1 40-residue YVTN family beta-propeller repeat protein [Pedosphaera parvula Ellin514]